MRKVVFNLKVVLLLMCSSACFTLHAQQPKDSTLQLPTTEFIYSKPKPLSNVHSITLDSFELALTSTQNLADYLSEHSTIFVKSNGPGSSSNVSFRGTAANHTKMIWNGIPVNSIMLGMADLSLFPLFLTDAISINYGLSSLQETTGGIGGSISLTTHIPNKNTFYFQTGAGSFGQFNNGFKLVSGNKKLRSSTGAYFQKAINDYPYYDFFGKIKKMPNAANIQYGIMQQTDYLINSHRKIESQVWYQHTYRQIPPLLTGNNTQEEQEDFSLRGNLKYLQEFKNLKVSNALNFTRDRLQYRNPATKIYSDAVIFAGGFVNALECKIREKFNLQNRVDFYYETANTNDYAVENPHRIHGKVNTIIDYRPISQMVFSLNTQPIFYSGIGTFLNGAISTAWKPHKNWLPKLFATVGINHDFPTMNQLYWKTGGNLDLRPEFAKSGEIGAEFYFVRSSLHTFTFTTSVFANYVEDYIQWQPNAQGLWEAVNVSKVFSRGIEGMLKYQRLIQKNKISGTLSGNYLRSENISKSEEKADLIYIPRISLQSHIRLEIKDYYLQTLFTYTSQRVVPGSMLPSYYLCNFLVGKKFRLAQNQAEIMFKANNIFNNSYEIVAYRPMPLRNFEIVIKLNIL